MSSGRITHLFLAQARGTPMLRVPEATALVGRGFAGCRHTKWKPGHARQVLLLDAASHAALDLAPGALKENVVVTGLALETLPPGQRLGLGAEVRVELTGPCVPCGRLEALRPGLLSAAWGQRGQLARIVNGGVVREGDSVTLLDVNPDVPRVIRPKLP